MKLAILTSFLFACAADAALDPSTIQLGAEPDDRLDKVELPILSTDPFTIEASATTPPPITYHGGPVMLGTTNVYLVWYGKWTGNTATTILPALAQTIGGSPYFAINTTYKNGSNVAVSNAVKLAGQTTDAYSRGTTLADFDVAYVVAQAVSSRKLPLDANGVYVVLTSADVGESSGFCTAYCGWHTYATYANTTLKIAFVGNADRCPTACAAQSRSPNNNVGADAMVSTLAHELSETVTDPKLDAWFDAAGAENADKCAWTFGATYTLASGARANVKLGGKDYLLQRNWLNVGAGSCALAR